MNSLVGSFADLFGRPRRRCQGRAAKAGSYSAASCGARQLDSGKAYVVLVANKVIPVISTMLRVLSLTL
jgi:hypothetical protein